MEINFDNYSMAPIHQKDAWRICDFVISNETRLKDFFPKTLKDNLTPTLAELFVKKKVVQFVNKEEYLFTIKENTNRTIIGLVYIKELRKVEGQGELAYCLGYQYEDKGIMSKAINILVSWAFTTGKLTTLQAIIHKSNLGSQKVVLKNRFNYITVLLKEHKMADGTVADMQLYELNESDVNPSP